MSPTCSGWPGGKVWLVDNQESRLKVFEEDGSLDRMIDLPGFTHDEAVGDDGSIALLRLHLGRIDLLTAEGEPAGAMDLSFHLGPVRKIGFPSEGGIEVLNAHGERFFLHPAVEHPQGGDSRRDRGAAQDFACHAGRQCDQAARSRGGCHERKH